MRPQAATTAETPVAPDSVDLSGVSEPKSRSIGGRLLNIVVGAAVAAAPPAIGALFGVQGMAAVAIAAVIAGGVMEMTERGAPVSPGITALTALAWTGWGALMGWEGVAFAAAGGGGLIATAMLMGSGRSK
jgi:hypothetical protein